jgi:2,3-bisphosphoglycerate-dependent phosphoglycerate mutase
MRLFVFARHAESSMNIADVMSTDPTRPVALTPRGREQARQLGEQIGNLGVDLAVHTRFLRTKETAELALAGRDVPLLVEPDLDEVRGGIFDGEPITRYWAWKERHSRSDRFPRGESLDDATRRYEALRRLLARPEPVTLVVGHELAIRYIAEGAAGANVLGGSEIRIPNAVPFMFDEPPVRRAAKRLEALAPLARPERVHTEAAA